MKHFIRLILGLSISNFALADYRQDLPMNSLGKGSSLNITLDTNWFKDRMPSKMVNNRGYIFKLKQSQAPGFGVRRILDVDWNTEKNAVFMGDLECDIFLPFYYVGAKKNAWSNDVSLNVELSRDSYTGGYYTRYEFKGGGTLNCGGLAKIPTLREMSSLLTDNMPFMGVVKLKDLNNKAYPQVFLENVQPLSDLLPK